MAPTNHDQRYAALDAAEFTDPRLVPLYDAVCNPREDIDFYVALAGVTPCRVLDLCCGTGQLAAALAARAHAVIGVDAAAAMLAIARDRPHGDHVTWIHADVRTVSPAGAVDLVVLSGHAFQAFLSDADVQALLGTARRALSRGGRLAFDTRNPLARAWEQWTPAASRRRVSLPGGEVVDVAFRVLGVHGDRVDSALDYRFPATGERLESRQTLRFPTRSDVARHLATAGFVPEAWYGDWDGSPCTEQSPEVIVIAR
jgi:SAM-dependent methyltransferase